LHTIPLSQHGISKQKICTHASSIISTLQKNGYDAYIVGGAIRDLLLNVTPKDFDIATSATPEQTVKLFNNARIIGRRFKIVHVRCARETYEVSTFRAPPVKNPHSESKHGLLLRDNLYGSIEEDAMRRDFSVNALYYDLENEDIIDLCDGYNDVFLKVLRCIGDPNIRFKEDPVRMLRAIRLAAKINLTIDSHSLNSIAQHKNLLHEVSSARLFDELLKLFMNGYAETSFHALKQHSMLHILLPSTKHTLQQDSNEVFIIAALKNSDHRVRQGKPITPAFFIAVFLWPDVHHKFKAMKSKIKAYQHSVIKLKSMQDSISNQHLTTTIPKYFQSTILDIWELQHQLLTLKTDNDDSKQLLKHPRFRAAYDFLLLREQTKESKTNQAKWWQSFQEKHYEILEEAKQQRFKKKRYRKR
jgi:poly(A) polymerase